MASRSSGLIGSGIGAAVGGYFGGPAGAQAGASAGYQIGDIFGARAREKYDANRQFEAEVRNYLFTKNLIDYQNEYNSPKNQMKRLQEAGLNPMLVYGGGNVTGNQSAGGSAPSTAPTLSKRQSRAFDIAMYQDIENKGLNNELLHERVMAERKSNNAFDTNQVLAVANAQQQNKLLATQSRLQAAQLLNELLFGNSSSGLATSLFGALSRGPNFKQNMVDFYQKNDRFPSRNEYLKIYGDGSKSNKSNKSKSQYSSDIEQYTTDLMSQYGGS